MYRISQSISVIMTRGCLRRPMARLYSEKSSRCCVYACGLLLVVMLVVFTITKSILLIESDDHNIDVTAHKQTGGYLHVTHEAMKEPKTEAKIILFWTPYYRHKVWWNMEAHLADTIFKDNNCPYDCVLSHDKAKVKDADVLMFFSLEDPNWPPVRDSHQYYIHYLRDCPTSDTDLTEYEGRINITMSYRHDSDLYVPHDRIIHIDPSSNDPLSDASYRPSYSFKRRTKSVLWLASDCDAASQRHIYVKELSKHIDIDIFGACGHLTCPRSQTDICMQQWESEYKFYLSFESHICQDYITENMFRPLKYDLVPVVFGGANYTKDAPPHSVINVRDFNSPKHLADYLKQLSSNATKYEEYFRWKEEHYFAMNPDDMLCELCTALHENRFGYKVPKKNYQTWWSGTNGEICDNTYISNVHNNW